MRKIRNIKLNNIVAMILIGIFCFKMQGMVPCINIKANINSKNPGPAPAGYSDSDDSRSDISDFFDARAQTNNGSDSYSLPGNHRLNEAKVYCELLGLDYDEMLNLQIDCLATGQWYEMSDMLRGVKINKSDELYGQKRTALNMLRSPDGRLLLFQNYIPVHILCMPAIRQKIKEDKQNQNMQLALKAAKANRDIKQDKTVHLGKSKMSLSENPSNKSFLDDDSDLFIDSVPTHSANDNSTQPTKISLEPTQPSDNGGVNNRPVTPAANNVSIVSESYWYPGAKYINSVYSQFLNLSFHTKNYIVGVSLTALGSIAYFVNKNKEAAKIKLQKETLIKIRKYISDLKLQLNDKQKNIKQINEFFENCFDNPKIFLNAFNHISSLPQDANLKYDDPKSMIMGEFLSLANEDQVTLIDLIIEKLNLYFSIN